MPLTSSCQFCGAIKDRAEWAADYCSACQLIRLDTRDAVSAENTARDIHNKKVLTAEKQAEIAEAARGDVTGERPRQILADLGVKPLIDMSTAIREALAQRAHTTNSGHADPRSVFNPGLRDARTGNLGMDSRIPPGGVTRQS